MRGQRKSERMQIDGKKEERLGRREEIRTTADVFIVFWITILVKQEFPIGSPLFNWSTTNNLSLLQVKASEILSNVN